MKGFALPIALCLAAPAAAQAPASIALAPGDAASIRVEASGAVAISPERGRAEWAPVDVAAGRHLSGLPIPAKAEPYATMMHDEDVPAPPVAPNMIRVKFLSIADRQSLLVLENGYGRAFVYRARMMQGDRTAPTDVCLVVPNQRSYEHWPHVIDRLEISGIRFVDWRQGDPIPCA